MMGTKEENKKLKAALGECLHVLHYIGGGVTAHALAMKYYEQYSFLLSDDKMKQAGKRVEEKYNADLDAYYKKLELDE